jgi:hypothetical protein
MSKFSRPASGLTIPRRGGVNYGDIVSQISVRPTQHMLDLAGNAGVPGGKGYGLHDEYDAVAVATYWSQVGKVLPLKSPREAFDKDGHLNNAGKLPALRGSQYEQGTRDPEQIKRWWGENPGWGVGLSTQASHVLAIDVDNGIGQTGELNFIELCHDLRIDLSEVPHSQSPNYHGGLHLLWRLPNAFPKMGLPAVSRIADHVDIPWFIVVAGSWKYTTLGYDRKGAAIKGIGVQTWRAGDPLQLPMAPKPLLNKLLACGAVKGVPATDRRSLARRPYYRLDHTGTIDVDHYETNGIPIGQQNPTLYRIACKMAGHSVGLPKHEAVDRCWEIIRTSPQKPAKGPWTYEQVERLVEGAYKWVAADNEKEAQERADIIATLLGNSKKGLLK